METAKLTVLFTADTSDFERGADRIDRELKRTEKGSDNLFDKMSSGFSSIGANIASLSVPLNGLFAVAINAAVGFNEQMVNIQSVMGYTTEETDAMGRSILDLSTTSKFGATEIASAMYDVVGGVADATQHFDILSESVALAEANNADLTTSGKALVSTLNAYASQGVKVTRISDVMTQVIKQGVGTLDELSASFAKTAGLASPLGISIEELGLMYADMSTRGLTFAQAGTQIEALLGSLLNPTAKVTAAFATMGLTQEQAMAQIADTGLIAFIHDMTAAGVDLTTVFTNREALMGALALAGMDSDALREFAINAWGATEATRFFARQATQFKIDTLMGDLNDLAIVIGDALLPEIDKFLDKLSPLVQKVTQWASENPELIRQAFQLSLGLSAMALSMTVLAVSSAIIATAFRTLATGGALLNMAFILLKTSTTAIGVSMGVLALPLVALIGAGLALAHVIGGNEGIVGTFNKAITAARQLVELGIMFVKQAFEDFVASPLFATLRGLFESALTIGAGVLEGIIGFFGSVITEITNFTSSPLFATIVSTFEGAFKIGETVLQGVVDFFGNVITAIVGFTESETFATILSVFESAFNLGVTVLTLVTDFFASVITAIVDFTQSETFATIIGAFETAFAFGVSIVEGVVAFFGLVVAEIQKFIDSPLFTAISDTFENAFGLVGDIIKMFIGTIETIVNTIRDVISSPVFQEILAKFVEIFEVGITAIVNGLTTVITGVIAIIQAVVDSPVFQLLKDIFETTLNAIGEFLTAFFLVIDTIITKIREVVDSDVFKTLENIFKTTFGAIQTFVEGVIGIITGLINGIGDGIKAVGDEINRLRGIKPIDLSINTGPAPAMHTVDVLSNFITGHPANATPPPAPPPRTGRGRATGGRVLAGHSYMVGEMGRERFTPDVGGMITPNRKIDGGGKGINISGTVNIYGVQDINSLHDQLVVIAQQRGF